MTNPESNLSLLVGTYTEDLPHVHGVAGGILAATYDAATGAIGESHVVADVRNPSWIAVNGAGDRLYTVVETVEFDGNPGGGAQAFERDLSTGELTLLSSVGSGGVEPAHIALDPSERFLVVANYRSGSVAVFALEADGSIGDRTDHVQHAGSSSHPIRQTGPHAHQAIFDPITGLMLVPDLGLDAVLFYELSSDGALTEQGQRLHQVPGAGPRHLAFHPDGEHLFLLNELDNTLVVYRRAPGGFTAVQTVSTLPAGFSAHSQGSEVRVSASGRTVWASNRGPESDSIAVFAFDAAAGTVELVHLESTRGLEPRDFVQSPDGTRLIVANQNSDTVLTFDIPADERGLEFVGSQKIPTPVCLVFASGSA